MTVVSHQHKYIFFRNPKTGSTSIASALLTADSRAFDNICRGPHKCLPKLEKKWRSWYRELHRSCGGKIERVFGREYLNDIYPESPDDYFKFTAVRNTWDRLVSSFFYYKNMACKEWVRYMGSATSFKEFVHGLSEEDVSQCEHLRRQNLWADGMDYIINYDDLQGGFAGVCQKIGIPRVPLEHLNPGTRKRKHYSLFYDDAAVDIVRELYAEDIEQFKFEFESP